MKSLRTVLPTRPAFLTLVLLLVALPVVLVSASAATATASQALQPVGQAPEAGGCQPWTLVGAPNPRTHHYLHDVDAFAPDDVWAVGEYYDDNNYTPDTSLVMHWDGTQWTIFPTPATGQRGSLQGVAMIAPDDVWAVGVKYPGTAYIPVTMHYDGISWTEVPTPTEPGGLELNDVVAFAPNDVWAVGANDGAHATRTMHWDGQAWSIVPSPNGGNFSDDNVLEAVAGVAPNDIWAVGYIYPKGGTPRTLILHWNGTQWILVPSPNPGNYFRALYGVTAIAANDVWAVGSYSPDSGTTYLPLFLHWNGTQWLHVPGPEFPDYSLLRDVHAVAPNDIWAVGTNAQCNFCPFETLTMHWDGVAWTRHFSPNGFRTYSRLYGVTAAAPGDFWAVGASDNSAYPYTSDSLIMRRICPVATPTGTPPTATSTRTAIPTRTLSPTVTPTQTPCAYTQIFSEGFESGTLGAFTAAAIPTNAPGWRAAAPGHTGASSAHAPSTSISSDQRLTTSGPVLIPSGASTASLQFWHRYRMEPSSGGRCIDGGVLEISTDGGATWLDAEPYMTAGGYDGMIQPGLGNPLEGRRAWCGDHMTFSQVNVNLLSFSGQNVMYRFREGTDSLIAWEGWWVDNIAVGYTGGCTIPTTSPTRTQTRTVTATSTPGVPPSFCTVPSFGPPANFAAGDGPDRAAVGDFNRDGNPDLAVANRESDNISVLMGNGAGGFSTTVNYFVGVEPRGIAVADFNLDGSPDLATGGYNTNMAMVLLNNGSGGFGSLAGYGTGSMASGIATADFNRDGKPDLVVADSGSDNMLVLLGNGLGNFGVAGSYDLDWIPLDITVADFNRDGNMDVAAPNSFSDNVSVRLGDGSGGFGPRANYSVGSNPISIAIGDFNEDGNPDFVTSSPETGNVSVRLGNGSGGFGPASHFPAGNGSASIGISDFNFDGNLDLAVANVPGNVAVLLGNGSGGFGPPTNFTAGSGPRAVAVGDFNRDGKPDLAVTNNSGDNVSLLLNTCSAVVATPTAPGGTPQATSTPTAIAGTPTVCAISFSDVPTDHTFYSNIMCLACRGILGGYADGTFRPGNDVTRGQLAKIVANAANFNEPVTGQRFIDVPPTHTFYEFIERMAGRGIIGGYADGTYRPGNPATRGQIAKIVANAANFNEPVTGQRFTDVPPTHTFYEFIERIASRGIIGGYADGTFRPGNNATRGQTAKIVANTFFPGCNP